jgi:hypothetical protein
VAAVDDLVRVPKLVRGRDMTGCMPGLARAFAALADRRDRALRRSRSPQSHFHGLMVGNS